MARGPGGRVLLCDSITEVDTLDRGAIVVTGSHGGLSAGRFALDVPLALVAFNDAGVGKDNAGIAALELLDERGVAAVAVSHLSARIGEAGDTWEGGIVSHVNDAAAALGAAPGVRLKSFLERLLHA